VELYHLFPGTILKDRYIVGQVLGFGGFGITYKAWDAKLETIVAIKEYYPSGIVNRVPGEQNVILFANSKANIYQAGLERFLDEARNMAKFNTHPNIVNIFEFFEQNNTAYIVMEFLDGVTLAEFLKENLLDVETCIEITNSICIALKELHSQGIVHRDVSPDNIFMCLNGSVKLIDFGAARFSAAEEQQMTVILKPGYAPPEQYEKISKQGPWTDIYALGATLYRMLVNEKPEESTNRKVNDTLQAPKEINADIPENISNTVMRAMALEQHMRFSCVDEFQKGLSGQKTILSVAAEKKKRKRKRFLGGLTATLLLVCGVIVLGISLMRQKDSVELPGGHIALVYQLTGDATQDAAKQASLEQIANAFMQSYPDVSVELIGANQEGYLDYIAKTDKENDGTLSLFESSGYSEDELLNMSMNVSSVAKSSEARLCYAYDNYSEMFTSGVKAPLSFNAMVLYCNTSVVSFDKNAITTLDDIGNQKIAVDSNVENLFALAFGPDAVEGGQVDVVEDPEKFINGDYDFYFASTTDHIVIQSRMPARYRIVSCETQVMPAYISETYSIKANISKEEEKIARAFLHFMLSDSSQDYLYIQNWTGDLPLNKGVLGVLESVYNDFENIFDNADGYSFIVK